MERMQIDEACGRGSPNLPSGIERPSFCATCVAVVRGRWRGARQPVGTVKANVHRGSNYSEERR